MKRVDAEQQQVRVGRRAASQESDLSPPEDTPPHSQSQQIDIHQLANLYARRNDILDHLRKERLHIASLGYPGNDPLHALEALAVVPALEQRRDLADLVIGRVEIAVLRGGR